jgi:hypothetical protein
LGENDALFRKELLERLAELTGEVVVAVGAADVIARAGFSEISKIKSIQKSGSSGHLLCNFFDALAAYLLLQTFFHNVHIQLRT